LSAKTLDSIFLVSPAVVTPHEVATDSHVRRIVDAILEDEYVRHPILSVAVGAQYVVLDGTHRLAALNALGVQRIPLQVLDRDDVRFDTWANVVLHPRGCAAVLETPLGWRRGDDAAAAIRVRGSDGQSWQSSEPPTTLGERYEMIMRVLTGIEDAHEVRRSIPALAKPDGPGSFVLGFRAWTLDDVIELARQRKRLYSGLTRVIATGRILNLKVPLTMLQDRQLDQAAWSAFIRSAKRRARLYDEPTVLVE
jgi:L-serine kinase (ATP) / ParB family transcriptional regulator, heme-responsive regulator